MLLKNNLLLRKFLLFFLAFALIFGTLLFSATADSGVDDSLLRKGDIDRNGTVTAVDARYILRISAFLEAQPKGAAFWAADADGDGTITSSDARLVLRASAGLHTFDPNETYSDSLTTYVYLSPENEDISEVVTVTTKPAGSGSSSGSVSVDDIRFRQFAMPAIPAYQKKQGTFAFISYGYGHGVGMSQNGAKYLASQGCTYDAILRHYYTGTRVINDRTSLPETVNLGGETVDLREAIARVTCQEIGPGSPLEALKAQAVTAYTKIKASNFKVTKNEVAWTSLDAVKKYPAVFAAVDAVWGDYLVDSSGKLVIAQFYAMSAGRTTSSQTVWGSRLSYLQPVDSPFDRLFSGYIGVTLYTTDQIRALVEQFNEKVRSGRITYCGEITLSDNPADWFRILAQDGAVSPTVGYVSQMRVGNQTITSCAGQRIRADLFNYKLRSHCLLIEYYGDVAG